MERAADLLGEPRPAVRARAAAEAGRTVSAGGAGALAMVPLVPPQLTGLMGAELVDEKSAALMREQIAAFARTAVQSASTHADQRLDQG